ncbi:unnamed protein product [Symbiodinium sp. CCMP2456]|nr:unnamed protein product [Symbiodinium sp. CCMP2456]
MTKQKKKRTDLNVPKFVIDRWNSGTSAKDEMADLLLQVNNDKEKFVTELELIIRKLKKFVLHINEGWYSESEMKSELKWSQSGAYLWQFVLGDKDQWCQEGLRGKPGPAQDFVCAVSSNQYDGVKEYYVTVRETAQHVHAQENEHTERKRVKACPESSQNLRAS